MDSQYEVWLAPEVEESGDNPIVEEVICGSLRMPKREQNTLVGSKHYLVEREDEEKYLSDQYQPRSPREVRFRSVNRRQKLTLGPRSNRTEQNILRSIPVPKKEVLCAGEAPQPTDPPRTQRNGRHSLQMMGFGPDWMALSGGGYFYSLFVDGKEGEGERARERERSAGPKSLSR